MPKAACDDSVVRSAGFPAIPAHPLPGYAYAECICLPYSVGYVKGCFASLQKRACTGAL
jgi:hypothetical protein